MTITAPIRTRRVAYELILALIAVVAITLVYAIWAGREAPRPSSFAGHALGIVGFLMMLATETLYSLRKRLHRFHFGRMTTWLQCHIFTGIVGPYLVLLHSAGRFHGLAGILSLLTVLIVASGFVGRYIYTAVPRNLDGVEVAVRDLEILIAGADRKLAEWGLAPEDKKTLQRMQLSPQASWKLVLARPWLCWRQRRAFRELLPRLSPAARSHATTLQELVEERYRLELQINSLATTRKLLALWHLIHLPLGGVLFMLAFLHIGGALYYATFLR